MTRFPYLAVVPQPLAVARIEFLRDYLSEEIPAAKRAVFKEHLAKCDECVAYLNSYQETIQLGKAAFAQPDEPIPAEGPEELVQAVLTARRQVT